MESDTMDTDAAKTVQPVTAALTQRIDRKCEPAYEALLKGIHEEAKGFDGFLRREVIKSSVGPYLEYNHVLHFDSEKNLRRWESSAERHAWLSRMSSMAVHTTPLQVLSGLETWFTLSPGEAIVPPPRYKMAIVTWIALFPLIYALAYALQPFDRTLPLVAKTMVSTALAVPLMTYVIMPRMTRLCARWLYPRRSAQSEAAEDS